MSNTIKQNNILLINGPNLNILGNRKSLLYNKFKLSDIYNMYDNLCQINNYTYIAKHSNYEGEIIDFIQENSCNAKNLIINAGALTHTSIALRDCIEDSNLFTIELHITNIYKRENFRHTSYLHSVSNGIIVGLGINVYKLGFQAIIEHYNSLK